MSGLGAVLRKAVDRVSPDWVMGWRRRRWLLREAAQLRRLRDEGAGLERVVDAVLASPAFKPEQKRSEILGLLRLLERTPPRRVLEIGGRRGGTLVLFTAVASRDARLLSLDLAYDPLQVDVNGRLGAAGQDVRALQGDSHAATTLERVRGWLGAEPVDFLFIDGDHSFAGVAKDFEMYGPLVKTGGTVAFHDIVPDSRTRHGVVTSADVGEVPSFWQRLKASGRPVTELVDDPEQDGLGIGVLAWSSAWAEVSGKSG
jgi:predicted O-methyltransferase YrrM